MISKISGTISYIGLDNVCVDLSNGIGYDVFLKHSLIANLKLSDAVCFHIRHIFKEDGQYLYGFETVVERFMFDELIKLNGLGPRIAVAILSRYTVDDVLFAINSKDEKVFSSISGIGAKIATRIVNEMQNVPAKIAKLTTSSVTSENVNNINLNFDNDLIKSKIADKNVINDAIEALLSFGFTRNDVYRKVHDIAKKNDFNITTEEIIKYFLANKS